MKKFNFVAHNLRGQDYRNMTNEERWETFIAELRAYIEEHHHCPNKHTTLLNQTKYFRKKMKEGKLSEEQSQELEEILDTRRMDEHTGGRRKKEAAGAAAPADKDIRTIVQTDSHITDFQRRVYLALLDVPRGETISYKELGERIGCKSAQAIGQALKRNPFAPDVPCHRVIASNGDIGGFHGTRDGEMIEKKRRILLEEGVNFS